MEYFTVTAGSYEAAVKKIRELYGSQARIHSRKTVKGKSKGLFRRASPDLVEVAGYLFAPSSPVSRTEGKIPAVKAAAEDADSRNFSDEAGETVSSPTTESSSGLSSVQDAAARKALEELKRVRKELARERKINKQQEDAASALKDILLENDFSRSYIDRLTASVFKDLTSDQLRDRLLLESRALGFIAESFQIDRDAQDELPRIVVLMGPTGVGKTTTIAKIAAHYLYKPAGKKTAPLQAGNRREKNSVSIVSIDNYRIGAVNQIETFGEILSVPVTQINSPLELDRYLQDNSHDDLILIDTIGKSPRDQDIFDEMQRILSVCGGRMGYKGSGTKVKPRFFLTLSASMKTADMLKTVDRFIPFRVSSLIVTKLDETELMGNILSAASDSRLPIAFLSTGQKVPQDMESASVGFFMRKLKGFTVDLEHLNFGGFKEPQSLH